MAKTLSVFIRQSFRSKQFGVVEPTAILEKELCNLNASNLQTISISPLDLLGCLICTEDFRIGRARPYLQSLRALMAFVSELVNLVVAGGRYTPCKYFYLKI